MENSDKHNEVRLWTQTLEAKASTYEDILKEVKHVAAGIRSDEELYYR